MWYSRVRLAVCIGMLAWAAPSSATLEQGIEAANSGQFEVALKEFQYLADMGYGPGIYELAKMYQGGYGVSKDIHKAAKLFQDAVNTGVADAMFSLAVMYENGEGVKQDKQKAVELYTRAAKKNLAAAQFNLGVMYTNGDGVIKDYHTAMDWYEKAAASNYTLAQFNLALMYYQGLGVSKNIEKSYIWNTVAEYNGSRQAAKSRQLDEQQLSPSQIERATEKANDIYYKIQERKYIPEIRPRKASF
ncbi:tetratricopeptide repeat protein [Pseudoalteromonas byunsanensis]|uniref:Protein prenylyltransferase domain-containing protein n=1 Tax=Pseudoalteromonas byunsanensis TaxID=327939 RepID=A0A1S1N460_9GAMM|nr:tetratricopeptide repeat protein [Pseudoalteromonas byunsanensis]OHU94449.1 protein prenylyltransferase domain-containing protein [Pseudoalteromonas byunsanensis]